MTRQRLAVDEIRHRAQRIVANYARLPPLARDIVDVVAARLDERVTLSQLARRIHRTPAHLNVAFRHATGLTVYQFVVFLRMTEAKRQLEGGAKVEAVARAVGYRSTINFYRQFRLWFEARPTDLRRHTGASS